LVADPSPSLIQDVLAGDPSAAAELQRMQESDVRSSFAGPNKGPLSSIFARALLGRSRSPSAALTREEERLLETSRPDLRYESAAANPHRTYPGSRLLTAPAIAALPAAGVGAGLGYLASSQTDLPAWAKSLITAGGAGVGGVAGSATAHALRQSHARALRREHTEKSASLVETLVPYVLDALQKEAASLGWLKGLLGGSDDAARAAAGTAGGLERTVVPALLSKAVAEPLASLPPTALSRAAAPVVRASEELDPGFLRPGKSRMRTGANETFEDPRSTQEILADPEYVARIHGARPTEVASIKPPDDPDAAIRAALQAHPEKALELDMLSDTLRRGGEPMSHFDPRVLSRVGAPSMPASGALGSLPFNIGGSSVPIQALPQFGPGVLRMNVMNRSPEEILNGLEWRPGGVPGTRSTMLPPAPTLPAGAYSSMGEAPTLMRGSRAPDAYMPTSPAVHMPTVPNGTPTVPA
jgi:hypothetical protein